MQFVAGEAGASVTALRITEVMYHPAAPPVGSPYTRDDFEYLELLNTSDGNLDLSGVATATYYIVGGTGRFAGASGTGDFIAQPNADGTLSYTAHGVINY